MGKEIERLKNERRALKQEMKKRVKAHIMGVYAVPGVDMEDFWVAGDEFVMVLKDGIHVIHQDRPCRRGVMCFKKTGEWCVYINVHADAYDDSQWHDGTISEEWRDWIMKHDNQLLKSCCGMKDDWYRYKDERFRFVEENF